MVAIPKRTVKTDIGGDCHIFARAPTWEGENQATHTEHMQTATFKYGATPLNRRIIMKKTSASQLKVRSAELMVNDV